METFIIVALIVLIVQNTIILCVLFFRKDKPQHDETGKPAAAGSLVSISINPGSVALGSESVSRKTDARAVVPEAAAESDAALQPQKASVEAPAKDKENPSDREPEPVPASIPKPVMPPPEPSAPKVAPVAMAVACPDCGRENSVFRDTCFNCGVRLPKS